MLRFSIREILLLTLTVACLAGWWKYHANAAAERARLAKESQHLRELLGEREAHIDFLRQLRVLDENVQSLQAKINQMGGPDTSRSDLPLLRAESENARLEAHNKRLQAESSQLKTEQERLRRRLLHHDTQVEILLEGFRNELPGS